MSIVISTEREYIPTNIHGIICGGSKNLRGLIVSTTIIKIPTNPAKIIQVTIEKNNSFFHHTTEDE